MFIDIDYDKRKKGYKINLAKPNQQTIASISEAYGANYSIKLGNINEVTFNVPYFIDKLDERVKNENIELIKEKMYTKISYNNNDEWMVIDTIEDVGSGDEKYMTVTAFTNVYETSNRKINELNLEVVNPEEYYNAILNDVAWSIGTIDPLFKNIYRSVELSNVTVLEAIITGAETFGAVLDFDTKNKKINLIDIDSRAKYRGLNINYSNFLQSINRKRSVDEMTTRLYVYGSEDLSIENVNPTGMRYLEDFTYFLYPFERDENKNVIKSSHYMSDKLAHAILDKNELSKKYQPQIKALQKEIDEETVEYINETTLLNELRFDEMSVSGLLDIAKATEDNDLILQRQGELAEVRTKISIKELTVDHISAIMEDLERQISQLQSQISVTSFSKELYDELSMYIIESEFRDDRYIDEEELYRDALKKFDESKSPSVVIEASIDNIIDSLEEDYYSDKVVLGDIARVTDKEMNVEMKSLIVELSFDLDNNTCDVTIANGDIEKDGYDRILSVLYDTQSTTTMLENNKYKWDTVTDVKTEVDLMRDSEIDATRNRIKAGFRESVTIEDRGIILSNPDFPDEIVIMQAGVIALSTDGGENWSTSITPRGVMADTIIGKLVASNNLIVTNDSGSFRIDGDGLTVDMDSIKITSGEGDTPENIVDSWNKMLITMDEFADDGKLNEYEKNQIARQWNSIAIAHSSMVDAIQNAYGPETPENPYPAEYEIYMESYEKLRRYLNDEIQSDGHTILDPLHRGETTDIDSDKYNRLVSDYEVNKDRFQTVIPLEFSQTFLEQTRKEISLNYVKNGEVATKLNLSEEGVRIDGRLLEVNSETHFNDDLVMNAGLIRSADNAINIDLNKGIINLSRPLTINAVPVATEDFVKGSLSDAIKNIDVEYGITSDKNTPPSDWKTTSPTWEDGKYIWSRTITVYKNGNTEITEPVNITGASGGTGKAGRSVKSIQEQYYLSTSPLDLENGSWMDEPPEWEPDKYIWTRSVITYENPSGVSRTEPISVSGQQGPKGEDAPLVKLSGKTQIIKQDRAGRLTPSSDFTVTGSSMNTTINSWRYSTDGGDFITSPPTGVIRSGTTVTVNPTLVKFNTLTIRASDGQVSDEFTVARAVDGATGEDAYTVILTNESHTFAGNVIHAIPSSTTTDIIAYKGSVRVPVTISSVTGMPRGMNNSISSNGTINTRVTFTVDEKLVEESGTVKLNLALSGQHITKEFSFAVAYKGERGEKGERGATGSRGPQGNEGVGISSVTEHYLVSNQSTGVTYSTSGWGTSIPTMTPELRFLWNYEEIHFTDGTSEPTLPVVVGVYGQQGPKGSEGEDGRSITDIEERYLVTSSASGVTRSTSGWTEKMQVTTPTEKYLWNYEIITWSKAPLKTYVEPIIIGIHGDKGEQGPRGLEGLQGPEGKQGIQGPEGDDGLSSYTHIAYATGDQGQSFNHDTFPQATYIGMYVSHNQNSSDNWRHYEWTLIKGKDGSQGLRGPEGKDGRTPYFHTAWANNSAGTSGFSTTVSTNKLYIGTVTTFEPDDPEEPSVYSWTKIKGDKGEEGDRGPQGIQGPEGKDGKHSYTHIAYATGTEGQSFNHDTFPQATHIGMYVSDNQNSSDNWKHYEWTLIKGRDGKDGIEGKHGTAGMSSFVHFAYANSANGTVGFSTTDSNRDYIGTYTDSTITDFEGGRNLVLHSHFHGSSRESGDSGWRAMYGDFIYLEDTIMRFRNNGSHESTRIEYRPRLGILEPDTWYTFSMLFQSDRGLDVEKSDNAVLEKTTFLQSAKKYSVQSFRFKVTSNEQVVLRFYQRNPLTVGGVTDIDWVKIEKGKEATDWTPAPEDIIPDSNNPADYSWSKVKGDKGDAGKGIKAQDVTYQNHTNGTTAPTGSWVSSPNPVKGRYLWTRTVTTYTEGNPVTTYAVSYNATDGQEGTGISSTEIRYQQSTSGSATPTGTWQTSIPTPTKGRYLWTRTVITYTDGTKSTSYSTSYYPTDGEKGDKGDTGDRGPRGLQGLQGPEGKQGIEGKEGKNGLSSYTHIAYATGTEGQSFNHSTFEQATHIGMYVSNNQNSSGNWRDYEWTLIKGKDGRNGIEGKHGTAGMSSFFHTAYADSADGTVNFSTTNSNRDYIGTYTDSTITDFDGGRNLVLHSHFYGSNRESGDSGWSANYGWFGFSDNTIMRFTNDGSHTATRIEYRPRMEVLEPNTWYTFSMLFQSDRGLDVRGFEGASPEGEPFLRSAGEYTVQSFKFRTNSTGEQVVLRFYQRSPLVSGGVTYIDWVKIEKGDKATDWTPAPEDIMRDSNNPKDYIWTKIKGDKGDRGPQGPEGIQGPEGKDGQSQYVHMRYSASSNGSGFGSSPNSNTKYIGIAVTSSSSAPTGASSYTWSKFVGEDGDEGIQGPEGKDGKTTYTWVKYADDVNGNGMSDSPSGKMFIGLAFNKTTQSESSSPSEYAWSAMYDEEAFKGIGLADKVENLSGTEIYTDKADDSNVHVEMDGRTIGGGDTGKNIATFGSVTTSNSNFLRVQLDNERSTNGVTAYKVTSLESGNVSYVRWRQSWEKGVNYVASLYAYDPNGHLNYITAYDTRNQPDRNIRGVENLGDGWYRYNVRFTPKENGFPSHGVLLYTNNNMPKDATVLITHLQLEKRNSVSLYEPPAPHLEKPIEMESVNDVEIISSIGKKNLERYSHFYNNSNNGWIVANSPRTFNGHALRIDANGSNVGATRFQKEVHLKDPGEYTLSARVRGSTRLDARDFLNARHSRQNFGNQGDEWRIISTTFEIIDVYQPVTIRLYMGSGAVGQWVEMDWVKIERGTKATPWVPHPNEVLPEELLEGAISKVTLSLDEPLRSIGDIKDRLFRDDDDGLWKVERKIREYTFNGAQGFQAEWLNSGFVRLGLNHFSESNPPNVYTYKTNMFTYQPNGTNRNLDTYVVNQGNPAFNRFWAFLDGNALPSKTDQGIRDYFSRKPLKVLYDTHNPSIQILDEESQNSLNNLLSFSNSNYVYTHFPDKDDILAERLEPTLHATFKGGGWYSRWKTEDELNNKTDTSVTESIQESVNNFESVKADVKEVDALKKALEDYVKDLGTEKENAGKAEKSIANLLERVPLVEHNLGELTEKWNFVDTTITMGEEGILIGDTVADTGVRVGTDRIDFVESGAVVAYISNQTLYIERGIFVKSLTAGEHKQETISSGITVITWVG